MYNIILRHATWNRLEMGHIYGVKLWQVLNYISYVMTSAGLDVMKSATKPWRHQG